MDADALARSLERPASGEAFSADALRGLPEPARGLLVRAVAEGAPLASFARLSLAGTFRLGRRTLRFTATETIAPARGFVWRFRMRLGPFPVTGVDSYAGGEGRLDARLLGLLPLARASGPEVSRSAAGRLAAESLWVPTALLPRSGATWEARDGSMVRVSLPVENETPVVEIEVAADGRVVRTATERWREGDAKNGRPAGPAIFETMVEGERVFGPYTIPLPARAGWRSPEGVFEEFIEVDAVAAVFG